MRNNTAIRSNRIIVTKNKSAFRTLLYILMFLIKHGQGGEAYKPDAR